MKTILTIGLLLVMASNLGAQTVELKIGQIKNKKGHLQLMFYKNTQSFKDDKPYEIKRFCKDTIKDGCMCLKFDFDIGEYGIILLDDENNTEDMEYNFFGIPKEGFGFAGYYHRGLRRPRFDDFKFELKDEVRKMKIKIRYF